MLATPAIAASVGALAAERDRPMLTGAVSSDLTGKFCTPTLVMFGCDSYAEANVPVSEVVNAGGTTWFSLTADYALGYALENDGRAAVESHGGKMLGAVRTPFGSSDFSSYLLTGQSSGAKVLYFAEAGKDLTNALKQASEFGLAKDHIFVAPHLELLDAKSVGLDVMGGTYFTEAWYWDQDEESRAFAKRFFAQRSYMPLRAMVSLYSMTTAYLKAVQALNPAASGRAVLAQIRTAPINDVFVKNGHLREDGRLIRDMYVAQVKTPAESKGPWDLYKILRSVPGDQAFRHGLEERVQIAEQELAGMPLLEVQEVRKNYGPITVLKGVSFSIEAGGSFAVIGPNGAGKTTLLKVVTGEVTTEAGAIRFGDDDITHAPAHRRVRAGIGRTFQVSRVFLECSALEGEFNWPSQHLREGWCDGRSASVGSCVAEQAAFAWAAWRCTARAAAAFLGIDCGWPVERGRGDWRGRVGTGRSTVVSEGGRHATIDPCAIIKAVVRAISVVCRARRACDPACPRRRGAADRSADGAVGIDDLARATP